MGDSDCVRDSSQFAGRIRKFLYDFPSKCDIEYSEEAQKKFIKALFSFASCDLKYMKYFFPDGSFSDDDPTQSTPKDDMHLGRPCCHKFLRGELTYRCKTCGIDATCVLCSRCFNNRDHMGHQVIVSVNSKDNGGICDCGDAEAWKKKLHCRNTDLNDLTQTDLSDEFIGALETTISTVSDYVLDVFCNSPIPQKDFDTEKLLSESQDGALDPEVYGRSDINFPSKGFYSLVLWNDEKHSYTDFANQICSATKKKKILVGDAVMMISKKGRHVIKVSKNFNKLIGIKKVLEQIGLTVTIRPSIDTFREEMAATIINWLHELVSHFFKGNYQDISNIICKVLMSEYKRGTKNFNFNSNSNFDSFENNIQTDYDLDTINSNVSSQGNQPTESVKNNTLSLTTGFFTKTKSAYWTDGNIHFFAEEKYRIDYFLLIDLRLWKELRYSLRDFFISTLISNLDYKLKFGVRLAEQYPKLAELYMLADREPDCTIMSLSTQLFTCPSISTKITELGLFQNFIVILYTYLTKFKISDPSTIDIRAPHMLQMKSLKNRRFSSVFHDIDFIMSRNSLTGLISCNKYVVRQSADLLSLFQSVNPFERRKDSHVEYESDSWVTYFNSMPQVLQYARLISSGLPKGTSNAIFNSIQIIADVLTSWAMGIEKQKYNLSLQINSRHSFQQVVFSNEKKYTIVNFKVESEKLSLHHPLHVYLSWLIEFSRLKSPTELRDALLYVFKKDPLVEINYVMPQEEMLYLVLDYPIRVVVCLAQIRAGLWVRNGFSIRSQNYHYRELTLRDSAYMRDIFMHQVALTTLEPARIMISIIDRWDLLDWMKGIYKHPVYDELQLMNMLEEFTHLLIALLTFRVRLTGKDEETVRCELIYREILQCLCFGPLPFSEIVRRIPEFLSGAEEFENILKKLAIFSLPNSFNDAGSYKLRDEYFSKVDTHYLHYVSTQRDESDAAVRKNIARITNTKAKDIVVEPELEPLTHGPFRNLSLFIRSKPFLQFLSSTMNFLLISNEDKSQYEGLMDLILHLIHISLVDDSVANPDLSNAELFTDLYGSFAEGACLYLNNIDYKTIYDLLCAMAGSSHFESFFPKLKCVFEIFQNSTNEAVQKKVSLYAEILNENPLDSTMEIVENEIENKKRLAKERRAKIMADMLRQQQEFASVNDCDTDEDSETSMMQPKISDHTWNFPNDDCILCRKPANSSMYGTIGYISKNCVFRLCPFQSPKLMYEAISGPNSLNIPDNKNSDFISDDTLLPEFDVENVLGPGYPPELVKSHPVGSSCGHVLHVSCYDEYIKSARSRSHQLSRNHLENDNLDEFLCPLCKSLSNILFPVLWNANKIEFNDLITDEEPFKDWVESTAVRSMMDFELKAHSSIDSSNLEGYALCNDLDSYISSSLVKDLADKVLKASVDSDPVYMSGLLSRHQSDMAQIINLELAKLKRIYLHSNRVLRNIANPGVAAIDDWSGLENWLGLFGTSITALEISLRGNDNSNGRQSIFYQMPQQSITSLRIIRETILTFIALGCKRDMNRNSMAESVIRSVNKQVYQIFPSNELKDSGIIQDTDVIPFFDKNSFGFLAEFSLTTFHFTRLSFFNILKLCYISEIIKIIVSIAHCVCLKYDWVSHEAQMQHFNFELYVLSQQEVEDFKKFLRKILSLFYVSEEDISLVLASIPPNYLYTLICKFILPFLRQCSVLCFIIAALSVPEIDSMQKSELLSLTRLLKLPKITEVFKITQGNNAEDSVMVKIIERWCHQTTQKGFRFNKSKKLILAKTLYYPGEFHLYHLPVSLNVLFNYVVGKKCNNCKTVPLDPAICLFCGELTCAASYCCLKDRIGECNSHVADCGGETGIFFLVKRCCVLLLHRGQGAIIPAPYLDLHAEVDQSMKRGLPQRLSQKRYDILIRNLWLQNNIGSFVARKIESSPDNGGWETL